jgi:hypothetical protein
LREMTFNHGTACVRFQLGELASSQLAKASTGV